MMPMSVVLHCCSGDIVQGWSPEHPPPSSALNKIASFRLASMRGTRCKGFRIIGHGTSVVQKPDNSTRIEATLAIESRLVSTEDTMAPATKALVRAKAVEAVALAREAVRAAKEAATLVSSSRCQEYVDDFPSEMDRLLLERARLSEMMEIDTFQVLDEGVASPESSKDTKRNMLEKGITFNDVGMNAEVTSSCSSLSESVLSHVLERDSMHDILDEGEITASCHQKTELCGEDPVVAAKSKRREQRLEKRKRATIKARTVMAATTAISLDAAAKPKSWRSRKALSQVSHDHIQSLLTRNGSKRSKLLTATEEIEYSRKVQDLLRMEAVKRSLQEHIGREPTIAEWAKALGMDVRTFSSRLSEGRQGKDMMIQCNLRLVISVAKTYQGKGMSMQDLIQEGSMGLIRGCEKFDPEKGFKFSTYAHWWIRQAVTRAISEQSRAVRLPAYLHEIMARIWKAKRIIYEEYQRPPCESDIAELMGISVEKLRSIARSTKLCKSLDKPVGKDQNATLGEFIADDTLEDPESRISRQLLKLDLSKVLKTLNEREVGVVKLRYGLEDGRMRTLEEIGRAFNVTRERVRQIEAKALRKLKQPERNAILRGYMDS